MLPRAVFEVLECRRLYSGNPVISIGDVSLAEGQGGAMAYVFNVSLSKPGSKRISVDFATANGSAQAGQDYVANCGMLVFTRGETCKTITVLVNGDTSVEENEAFTVKLRHAHNASLRDGTGVGTIGNDDILPPPPLPPAEPSIDNYNGWVFIDFFGP